MEESDVVALRAHGFTDEAIHDAVQVIAYFNYINRIADALGTDLEADMPPKPKSPHPPRPAIALPPSPRVTLEPVTKESLRDVLRLRPATYQERFVASVAVSLAQASFHEGHECLAVTADGTPVGFVMLHERPDDAEVHVVRFLIDERFQGLGLGRRALELVLAHARSLPWARRVTLTFVPADGSPEGFYRKRGFTPTGRADEDGELEMSLDLG